MTYSNGKKLVEQLQDTICSTEFKNVSNVVSILRDYMENWEDPLCNSFWRVTSPSINLNRVLSNNSTFSNYSIFAYTLLVISTITCHLLHWLIDDKIHLNMLHLCTNAMCWSKITSFIFTIIYIGLAMLWLWSHVEMVRKYVYFSKVLPYEAKQQEGMRRRTTHLLLKSKYH